MFLYKQRYFKEKVEIRNALMDIYGIGFHKSMFICIKLGLGYPYSIDNLNFYNYSILISVLDELT
jgi:ribosomal protein S13